MKLPARSGRYQQNSDTGELQPFAREPAVPVATAPPEPEPVAEPPAPAFFTEPTPEPTEAETDELPNS